MKRALARVPVVLPLLVVGLLAAACGGDQPSGGVDRIAPDDAPPDDSVEETDVADDDAPSGPSATDAPGSTTTVAPIYGGELSFVVEGETTTWDLPNAECATSCVNVFRLVADPLFVEDESGLPQPFLLESAEADDSFREWTLTLRDGISFQNGEPVNGDALALDLERKSRGLITGSVLGAVESIVSDGASTVTITFGAPHSSLPSEMTSVLGFLMAPEFYGPDHDRGAGGPIGTGPFVFADWAPGDRLLLERNPSYWRTDRDGRELPFVDSVLIRPVPTKTDREAIIEADDADLTHVDDVEDPSRWLQGWTGGLLTDDLGQQTSYGMFNADALPFSDPDARRAVTLCTDRATFNQIINPASTTANGPFAPGSVGYLEDSGFPEHDPAAGAALVDAVGGLAFEYLTTNDASEGLAARLLTEMWSSCGIDVSIEQLTQGEVITRALIGDFDLVSWRLHGSTNPAAEYIWWHSDTAQGLALNAGRIRDATIDAGLEAMRATNDLEAQTAAAESINRAFGDGVYNLWYAWSEWWIVHQPDVEGVGRLDLPDGGASSPKTHGDVWLQQAWLDRS